MAHSYHYFFYDSFYFQHHFNKQWWNKILSEQFWWNYIRPTILPQLINVNKRRKEIDNKKNTSPSVSLYPECKSTCTSRVRGASSIVSLPPADRDRSGIHPSIVHPPLERDGDGNFVTACLVVCHWNTVGQRCNCFCPTLRKRVPYSTRATLIRFHQASSGPWPRAHPPPRSRG